ncbi:hypothetical protein PIB30_056211 [Stylosanthes scabra]|uniref:BHLH domain-containing protein n=1 Tax=Stylosanthes scabra TaxID=79078 RepID=A0ABU6QK07_9FABA|nr:hypothetical protein [Stylosanthes scabra]
MAEDQFQASGNWWENPAIRNNWQQQQEESDHMIKPTRVSLDSSVGGDGGGGGSPSVVFHDPQKLQPPESTAATSSTDPNLHFMALGLSSPPIDWNQQPSFLRGEKGGDNSFRAMLQEEGGGGMGLSAQQVHHQWRSPENEFKNNRGFCLEQNQFSPQYSSGDSTVTSQQGFHHHQNMDHSAVLYGSPSSILQGLLGPDHHHHNTNFSYPTSNYGLSSSSSNEFVPSSSSSNWSNNNNNKVPQFLRGSPPKQLSNSSSSSPITTSNTSLHFTNNAPFWNAAAAASDSKDVRSSSTFFPNSLQPPFFTAPSFDVQSKNMSEMRDSGAVVKKSGSEGTPKRPRNETTPSPLPAFKVRKEKMGDRITALQQLVSPFGKTDTASVLSEAIEYIKFLHEQVTVLSTPYMKSGAPIQIQQSSGKSKEGEGPKQDLRSRGLCLVPVSSTFPMTHETTVDFWTPTFGGGSR